MTAKEKTITVIITVIIILIIVWLISMTYTMPPGVIPAAHGSVSASDSVPAATY